jgi:hypothetical protein
LVEGRRERWWLRGAEKGGDGAGAEKGLVKGNREMWWLRGADKRWWLKGVEEGVG